MSPEKSESDWFNDVARAFAAAGESMDVLADSLKKTLARLARKWQAESRTAEEMRPHYMGYSRKRFIKLAMSYGLQRNDAAILAKKCRSMAWTEDIPTMISILDQEAFLPKDIVPAWMPEKKKRHHWERLL